MICEYASWGETKEKDQREQKNEENQEERREREVSVQSTQLTKQPKNMMTGITQGYTKNSESRGIGYQGKIIERRARNLGVNEESENGVITKEGAGKQGNREAKREEKETREEQGKTRREAVRKRGQSEKKIEETGERERTTGKEGVSTTKGIRRSEEIKKYLVLNLGWSHQIKYPISEQRVSASILQAGTVSIFGISSFQVNQTAAEIYRFKKPEPYKGKGIRYDGEKYFEKTRKG
jgi:large subunit ribosomal protein L6